MRTPVTIVLFIIISAIPSFVLFVYVRELFGFPSGTTSSRNLLNAAAAASTGQTEDESYREDPYLTYDDRTIVIGKKASEDTAWVQRDLPDWHHAIYTVDDNTTRSLHTPTNKGREALPYLQYIVDNYHRLPSIIAFVHSHKDGFPAAWHTEGIDHSNVDTLQSLRLKHVHKSGFVNLRCNPTPGCPDEVQPYRVDPTREAESHVIDAWHELFGEHSKVPEVIATPCCAQFAVSRSAVLRRSLDEYRRYMNWVINNDLDDDTAGRIMEYMWHIIFGKEAVFCPDMDLCFSEVYGW